MSKKHLINFKKQSQKKFTKKLNSLYIVYLTSVY